MPATVTIANRPLLPRLILLFWVAEIGVGLLFAWAGYGLLGPGENGGALVLVAMGAVLTALGVVMATLCWRVASLRGIALEMTDEGLLDRRLSETRIAWEAIAWKVIFNGRSYSLQMDLDPAARRAARIHWPQRVLGFFSRALRQPEFAVATLGTGLSAHDIAKHMEAFKAPMP